MKNEIQEKLEKLAYNRTIPFCNGCNIKAPKGRCPHCMSDDLMRHLDGVGVDWGTDWVIKHILEEELTAVDLEEAFEDSVRSCYSEEVKIGWITVDTVEVLKSQDPISWRCALSEYESQEEEEGTIMSFDGGSNYYWTHDLEDLVDRE